MWSWAYTVFQMFHSQNTVIVNKSHRLLLSDALSDQSWQVLEWYIFKFLHFLSPSLQCSKEPVYCKLCLYFESFVFSVIRANDMNKN